jgi:hypothetical protein
MALCLGGLQVRGFLGNMRDLTFIFLRCFGLFRMVHSVWFNQKLFHLCFLSLLLIGTWSGFPVGDSQIDSQICVFLEVDCITLLKLHWRVILGNLLNSLRAVCIFWIFKLVLFILHP